MKKKSLILKLTTKAEADVTLDRLAKISGITKIEQVFPDDGELELRTVYVVTVESHVVGSTLYKLSKDHDVEYARIPSFRRPF